jgi:hypothetical protein
VITHAGPPARESLAEGPRPVVFLGPSLPRPVAEAILEADYRPPVRRGDLDDVGQARTVLLIDGEFRQSLSVSPARSSACSPTASGSSGLRAWARSAPPRPGTTA